MKQSNTRSLLFVAQAGLIGGMYAALCILLAPISYGPIQVRVAEALTILPLFTPAAIPGLTVGCLIANLFAGGVAGGWDWLLGTLTTLAAALVTYALRRFGGRWATLLATLPPVLFNAVVIGAELAFVGSGGFSWPLFWLFAAQVGAGQLIACTGGGLLLAAGLRRTKWGKQT